MFSLTIASLEQVRKLLLLHHKMDGYQLNSVEMVWWYNSTDIAVSALPNRIGPHDLHEKKEKREKNGQGFFLNSWRTPIISGAHLVSFLLK